MQLKRLDKSLLVALGLAGCGPSIPSDPTGGGTGTDSGGHEGPMTDPSTPTSVTDPSDPSSFSTGPCLDVLTSCLVVTGCLEPPLTTTTDSGSFIEPVTGPCLSIPETESWTGSGTETDTDTDTDTDSDSDSDTDASVTGGEAPSRREVTQRLLEAGILPADLADRLARSR